MVCGCEYNCNEIRLNNEVFDGGQALQEAAAFNKLDVWGVNLENGVMEAFSQALPVLVVVSFEANGVQAWYFYEGRCEACNRLSQRRSMLLADAEERGARLSRFPAGVGFPGPGEPHVFSRLPRGKRGLWRGWAAAAGSE